MSVIACPACGSDVVVEPGPRSFIARRPTPSCASECVGCAVRWRVTFDDEGVLVRIERLASEERVL